MSARDEFCRAVFDRLWKTYRERVPYVRVYERVIAEAGATFVNDHVAFRTIAWTKPAAGIASVSRIFEALGYAPAGVYRFPDKHLHSTHFQHPDPGLPKLFVSELLSWELPAEARRILDRSLSKHRPGLEPAALAALASLRGPAQRHLLAKVVGWFSTPWPAPARADVEALDEHSQFAAWTLVHGYAVNHFTCATDDIEKTVSELRRAGVPMKAEIEGERGSKLRQSATQAAVIRVPVRGGTMDWTYAYFEIAERGEVVDPETGRRARFEGFLGPQATQLFEMTRSGGPKS